MADAVEADIARVFPRITYSQAEPKRRRAWMPRLLRKGADTGGELIYAIGDVHGRYDLLLDLLEKIGRDLRKRAHERIPILVFCGDYVDRGPDSASVVEAVIRLRGRGDIRVRTLKGNHEQAMAEFIADPTIAWPWLRYGGRQTLESYGVRPPTPEPHERERARDDLLARIPQSHLNFLDDLELSVAVGDYAFVHAGVRPGVPLERQDEQDLLWIREDFLNADHRLGKIVVHGHTWDGDAPQHHKQRIGIDTGAYSTGVLTALVLDGPTQHFLHARRTQDV